MPHLWTLRVALLCVANLTVCAAGQELPPVSPPVDAARMTVYTNGELRFAVRYPVEFKAGPPQDLVTVMRRGHTEVYGGKPEDDAEHREAERCTRPLLYATSTTVLLAKDKDPVPAAESGAGESADSVLVMDVERSCVPKKLKGDKALTRLTGSVLHIPGMTQVVQQMWFQGGGGRHIHSGMAGGMVTAPAGAQGGKDATGGVSDRVPFYIAVSAFEQRDHWILVAYLQGTRPDLHRTLSYTSVRFEDGPDVLLFPYLLAKVNLAK